MALYRIENISHTYRLHGSYFASQKEEVQALDSVSFHVPKGSMFGIVGQSGSGKSTLMRLLVGLERPTAGSIYFQNEDGTELPVHALQKHELTHYQSRVKLVFQDPASSLNYRLSVQAILLESIRYSPRFQEQCKKLGMTRWALQKDYALDLIRKNLISVGFAKTNIDSMLQRYPTEFSGGQRQRIAIVRALIHAPSVLVCDEVTSSLDAETRRTIVDMLVDLCSSRQMTLLCISHDLGLISYLCDNLVVLKAGKVIDSLSYEELMSKNFSRGTKELLDALPSLKTKNLVGR